VEKTCAGLPTAATLYQKNPIASPTVPQQNQLGLERRQRCAILSDPVLLRQICKQLSIEKDPETVQELFSLLRVVLENDQARLRSEYLHLANRYSFLREKLKR
jgi:hypothetical protein